MASFEAAQAGLKVLVIERRPVLAWELCWAHAPYLKLGNSFLFEELRRKLGDSGLPDPERPDPAISEIILDEIWGNVRFARLHHVHPLQIYHREGTSASVVAAGKAGQMAFRGRCFLDATERGFFWRQCEAIRLRNIREKGRFSAMLWLAQTCTVSPRKLNRLGSMCDVTLGQENRRNTPRN